MRIILTCLLIINAVNCFAVDSSNCSTKPTLSFGMVPITSSNLTELWSSKINRHIQEVSCLQLSFGSASNFKHYMKKAGQGDFDVLAAPPHIASYLITTAGFKPVAFLVWESSYLYVVPNHSDISSINQIKGGTLALPDPLAEASILSQQDLSAIQSDVNIRHYNNFNMIFSALIKGDVDMGVVLSPFYNAYKKRIDIKIRTVESTPFPSHGMLIAAPHIKQNQSDELFDALAALEKNAGLFWDSFEAAPHQKVEQLHLDQANSVEALKTLINK